MGDLLAGHVHTVHNNISMGYLPANSIVSVRITPTILKSQADAAKEQATQQAVKNTERESAQIKALIRNSRFW
jgi:propanediol dehydratase small subunit